MSREIKFRGKTLEDRGMLLAGSWIKGGYYVDYCYGGCPQGKHYIVTWNSTGLGFADLIQVDPETVGQYTGLKDSSGKEIYEGDLLRVTHEDGDSEVYQVRYMGDNDYPAFDLVPHLDCDSNGLSHAMAVCEIEVIGNIYEHSHLLK